MQFIPIKTRIMQPPKDDIYEVLEESLPPLKEEDVVLISSKVVAIHQGRCIQKADANRGQLVVSEADVVIHREAYSPLTITHNTFLGSAGIDESNGNGYLILLPKDIFNVARDIYAYLKRKHRLQKLGVIITDSRSQPFRFGALGVGLGFWGVEPLQNHIGKKDLFGREMRYERSNIIDGLAAGAVTVAGEVDECQPVVIARDVPHLTFTEKNCRDELFVSPEEDRFKVLYEQYLS